MYFAAVFASGLQWYVASNTRIALCSNSGLLPFLSPRTQCWQVFEVAPSGTKWHTWCWHVSEVAPSGTKWHTQCWRVFEVAPSGTLSVGKYLKWHQVAPSGTLTVTIWRWVALSGTKWHTDCHQVALSGTEWHQVAHSLPPSGSKVWSRARSIRGIGWIERALNHIFSILRRMNMPYLRTKWRWVALSGTKWHTHCHQVAAKSGPEPVLSEGLGG